LEVQRALVSLVGRAWLTVELQHNLIAVSERARKTSLEQLELARLRQTGGLGTKLDLVRAQRELADNEGRLARARIDLTTSREVLGVLLGSDGPIDVTGVPEFGALPAADALEKTLEGRPDVAATQARVTLATRAVDQSWTDYLPTAGLLVTPTAQSPATPTAPALGGSAQVTAQVVAFDGLSRSGVRKEREAALVAARAQADEVRQRATSELRLAFEVLALREESARAAAASAKLALEAEALARAAWKEGATTNAELIEAERSARDAETLAEAARTSEWSARLDLLVAAGRRPAP
ncbi:MAG: TolC family protein, partial [Archangiaceae bacterium]|nr:TolC family protein [Archangiaceae bacterium]